MPETAQAATFEHGPFACYKLTPKHTKHHCDTAAPRLLLYETLILLPPPLQNEKKQAARPHGGEGETAERGKRGTYRLVGIASFGCILEAISKALRARDVVARQLSRNILLLPRRKRTVAHRAAIHGGRPE